MKLWRETLVLVALLWLSANEVRALGLGLCHYVQDYPQYTSWGYSGGETYGWGYLQPTNSTNPDDWNWTGYTDHCGVFHPGIDDDIAWAEAAEPNGNKKIWIQILTAGAAGKEVPDWAEAAGVEVIRNGDYPGFGWYNTRMGAVAPIWDPEFLDYFDNALRVLAERYDNNPTVEAVNIMGGGGYGEMSMKPRCIRGENKCETRFTPDIEDKNHPLVVSLARAWGKDPGYMARKYMGRDDCFCNYYYRGAPATCPCFDYYYILSVNRIIDLYMKHFKNKPAVLQLGNGLSGMGWVTTEVVRYANCKYGNRVWTKFNGWGPTATTFPSGDARYSYTGWEPGFFATKSHWRNTDPQQGLVLPVPLCGVDKGNGRFDDYNDQTACDAHKFDAGFASYEGNQGRIEYGRRRAENLVYTTIFNSSPAYLCLQSNFFETPEEYYFGRENCSAKEIARDFCIDKLNIHLARAPTPIARPTGDCAVAIRPEDVPVGTITPNPSPLPTTPVSTPTCPPTTPTANPTGSLTPLPTPDRRFNLDDDPQNLVNQADLDILFSLWNPVGPLADSPAADFNQDDKINETDLTILLSYWRDEKSCTELDGDCCIGEFGTHCIPPRLIFPYNEDGTVNTSGGCNPERVYPGRWCCSGCKPTPTPT